MTDNPITEGSTWTPTTGSERVYPRIVLDVKKSGWGSSYVKIKYANIHATGLHGYPCVSFADSFLNWVKKYKAVRSEASAPPSEWNDAVEAAAKACENESYAPHVEVENVTVQGYNNAVRDCAEAVRRLKR